MAPAHPDEGEKERKRAFPWLFRPTTLGTRTALDLSSPMAALRSMGHALLYSPKLGMLRVALGAALAVHAAWFASWLWLKDKPKTGTAGPLVFSRAVDRGTGDLSPSFRPSVANLVRGLETLMDPEGLTDSVGPAEGGEDEEFSEDAEEAAKAAEDGEKPEGEGGEEEGGAEKKAEEAAAAAGALGAGGAFQGGLTQGGGGSGAALGAGAAEAAGAAAKAEAAAAGKASDEKKRRMKAVGAGRKTHGSSKKSALGQLKAADYLSKKGKYGATGENAYEAADAAFQGQEAGGNPIEGGGVGDDGGGISPSASETYGVSEPMGGGGGTPSCPSGTYLKEGKCEPIESGNQTPYQGLLDQARMMVILAAVLALIGLILLLQKANPMLQIIGGVLLGAAAALVLAAALIGNHIKDKYGQEPQKEAIDKSGSDAMQGQSP